MDYEEEERPMTFIEAVIEANKTGKRYLHRRAWKHTRLSAIEITEAKVPGLWSYEGYDDEPEPVCERWFPLPEDMHERDWELGIL